MLMPSYQGKTTELLWKHLSEVYAYIRAAAETGIVINGLFWIVGIRYCHIRGEGQNRGSGETERHWASALNPLPVVEQ